MADPDKQVRAVDALSNEAAEVAAEEGVSTPAIRAAARRLEGFAREAIAELRRAELARVPPAVLERRPVRASILAMARDALVARLDAIRGAHPALELGFAHHKLAAISDDDLRSMLEDAELAVEGAR